MCPEHAFIFGRFLLSTKVRPKKGGVLLIVRVLLNVSLGYDKITILFWTFSVKYDFCRSNMTLNNVKIMVDFPASHDLSTFFRFSPGRSS